MYGNRFLNRIYELTKEGFIKWKLTRTVIKNSTRLKGTGTGHIYIIRIDKNNEISILFVNKYITDIETTCEEIPDWFLEFYHFKEKIKEYVEVK